MNVYIDGACSNNGQRNAKAGYGIYFGQDDCRNESGQVIGKQSNNTGELTAFIRCLEVLQDDIKSNKQICIHTDSEYVIKCATTYGAKLEQRNWKASSQSKEVPNIELVQKAYELYNECKHIVKLSYIRAHTANSDIHSIGNAEADRLANEAASIGNTREKKDKEFILDWITFHNKDKAKELGAKWNAKKKYWYVTDVMNMEELAKLKDDARYIFDKQKCISDKTYMNISYSKKEAAKRLGAKWDASVKSWYYLDSDIIDDEKKEALRALCLH